MPAAVKPACLVPAALLLIGLAATPAWAAEPDYGTPLTLPNAVFAADPTAIRVDDTYYLYPTTLDTAVECWSSTDFATWNYEGIVWGPAPPGAWNASGICAPHVLPYVGDYYLYYNSGGGIGVAVAEAPTGPFVDVYDHPLVDGFFVIDPAVFLDDDGQAFLYSTCAAPFGSICVTPMADPATLGGARRLLFRPGILNWEGFLVEGPWMLKHHGAYYLMYSGNQTVYPFYAIGYATADNPLGPFTKYEGNPILRADWAYDFWGPGHNSVVNNAADRMWMFYHTKVAPQTGWEREVRINEVAFDAGDRLYVVLDDEDDDDNDNNDNDDNDDDDDDDSAAGDDDDDTVADDDDDAPAEDDRRACGC
jgi:beta-xylosidase